MFAPGTPHLPPGWVAQKDQARHPFAPQATYFPPRPPEVQLSASDQLYKDDSCSLSSVPSSIQITVNGLQYTVESPDPLVTLNEFLRYTLGLVGTKKTCGEGGCGACAVTLTRFDATQQKEVSDSVNSCLRPLCSCDGMSITTVEGIGSQRIGFHPVQERLAECNGSQCGFCSPGMVMTMYSLLQNDSSPSEKEIEHRYDGNICRCTGYRPILTAMKTFAADAEGKEACSSSVSDIEELCTPAFPSYNHVEQEKKLLENRTRVQQGMTKDKIFAASHGACVHDSGTCKKTGNACGRACEEEKVSPKAVKYFVNESGVSWYAPTDLASTYALIQQNKGSTIKLVHGNTGHGIYKDDIPQVYINLEGVTQLAAVSISDTGLTVGAGVTITNLVAACEALSQNTTYPEYQTRMILLLLRKR